jgi:hypothetical protein
LSGINDTHKNRSLAKNTDSNLLVVLETTPLQLMAMIESSATSKTELIPLKESDPAQFFGYTATSASLKSLESDNPGTSSHRNLIGRNGKPVLLFCIPSAARSNGSYISLVLESIDSDIRSSVNKSLTMDIEVLVVDVSVSTQTARGDITESRRKFPHFHFDKLINKTYEACTAEEMRSDTGAADRPPCSVRQQTRDVTAALRQCADRVEANGWVSLVEDDTEMCPGSLEIMASTLSALSRPNGRPFVPFANYFSGTSFTQAGAAFFGMYASGRLGERPIDHLIWEAWGPEPRRDSPGNLFAHRGRVSVFEYRNAEDFRKQYDEMRFSSRQSDCMLFFVTSYVSSFGVAQ